MFEWLDDEEDESADEEGDGIEEDDEDNSDAAIEASFREQRARVRGSTDAADLRRMRRNLQDALVREALNGLAAARGRDLVELIDDRIAELRARQMVAR
jgi:hypothetical protein